VIDPFYLSPTLYPHCTKFAIDPRKIVARLRGPRGRNGKDDEKFVMQRYPSALNFVKKGHIFYFLQKK
jgi:hypothetical protein